MEITERPFVCLVDPPKRYRLVIAGDLVKHQTVLEKVFLRRRDIDHCTDVL